MTVVAGEEPVIAKVVVDDDAKQGADSNNRFAFDVYRQARQAEGNLFFSPASMSTALAMTYAGARGKTEREMAAVLHLHKGQNAHDGFSTLLDLLNEKGNGYSMRVANRLWGQQGFRFEDAFLRLTREKYHAELATLDFVQAENSRQVINKWVEEQTNRKITDLIPSGILNEDTRLVLTNAIYFDGKWTYEFPSNETQKASFHLTAKDETVVKMMHRTKAFPYAEDADAQIVSLPYRGNDLAMIIVLPNTVDGLSDLEAKLTPQRFDGWIKSLKNKSSVVLQVPKFKMKSQMMLSKTLGSLGMPSAFTSEADLSGISTDERLKIREVIHEASVAVDEKGTEAAAATTVVIELASADFGMPQVLFRANHPFLFVIRDNRSGAVLFMGRQVRPEAG